jgi:hypothetical protein
MQERLDLGRLMAMLLDGINHVAVLTADTDRLIAFYEEMFGATVDGEMREGDEFRLTLVKVGPTSELNVFEITGNGEAARQVPMFERGRLDHLGCRRRRSRPSTPSGTGWWPPAPATGSSPTSATSSASSSGTRTAWRARCASPTRTPNPGC